MRILIDTHILIYALDEIDKLSKSQKNAFSDSENIFFVSHISFLEIVIKQTIGKLPDITSSILIIEQTAIKNNFNILPLTMDASEAYRNVPLIKNHLDPFDRTIIATAKFEGMAIMTNDSKFNQYEDFVQLWK